MSDTIIEILKRENGVMKAFALVVLYHLYNVTRYKTSTSLLREIFSDPNQVFFFSFFLFFSPS